MHTLLDLYLVRRDSSPILVANPRSHFVCVPLFGSALAREATSQVSNTHLAGSRHEITRSDSSTTASIQPFQRCLYPNGGQRATAVRNKTKNDKSVRTIQNPFTLTPDMQDLVIRYTPDQHGARTYQGVIKILYLCRGTERTANQTCKLHDSLPRLPAGRAVWAARS